MSDDEPVPAALGGVGHGRGLYGEQANVEEVGDGDLSDAGVESIELTNGDINDATQKVQVIKQYQSQSLQNTQQLHDEDPCNDSQGPPNPRLAIPQIIRAVGGDCTQLLNSGRIVIVPPKQISRQNKQARAEYQLDQKRQSAQTQMRMAGHQNERLASFSSLKRQPSSNASLPDVPILVTSMM